MAHHVRPTGGRQPCRANVGKFALPIVVKTQQRGIERCGIWWRSPRRIAWVAVAIADVSHAASLDARGAMPGLHDEAIGGIDIGEYEYVVPAIVADRYHLVHGRQPAAQQAFAAACDAFGIVQLGEDLIGVIRARAARGVDRHSIGTLARTHEGGPGQTAVVILGIELRGHRRGGTAHFVFIRLAMAQQVIGQKVRFGQGDVREFHAEVRCAFFGVCRFGAFAEHASLVAVTQDQAAMQVAQVFEYLPVASRRRECCRLRVSLQRQLRGWHTHRRRRLCKFIWGRQYGMAAPRTIQSDGRTGGGQSLQKASTVQALSPYADGVRPLNTSTKTRQEMGPCTPEGGRRCVRPAEVASCTGLFA